MATAGSNDGSSRTALQFPADDPEELLGQSGHERGLDDTKITRTTGAKHIPTLRGVATYAGLVPMAFFGVLIRLGFEALADYDGKVIFPILWAQGVGCAIMGTSLALKRDINDLYPPLYTALTTGLAGSVTSFSSWMLDGFAAFANLNNFNRGGVHDTMDGLAYTFCTGAVSIACLQFGQFTGSVLREWHLGSKSRNHDSASVSIGDEKTRAETRSVHHRRNVIFDCAFIALACSFYAGALVAYFVGLDSWRPDVTFALLLGPPGAILRFVLSRVNTMPKFLDRFPMGTFIANMFGTAVLAASYVVQRTSHRTNLSITGCNAMIGLEQGFCGCLTTVSTFAVEARTIRSRLWKVVYVLSSIVLGHLLVMAIVGGVKWSTEGLGPFCH